VPIYNEREVLEELPPRVSAAMSAIDRQPQMAWVDHGLRDGATAMIERLADTDPRLTGVMLSRTVAHEAAIAAGLREVRADAVIVADADVQDSPELFRQLSQASAASADPASAVRRDRDEGLLQGAAVATFRQLAAALVMPRIGCRFDFGVQPGSARAVSISRHHRKAGLWKQEGA
jgi:glycosyltransferase involved in cell wall biosynthesis